MVVSPVFCLGSEKNFFFINSMVMFITFIRFTMRGFWSHITGREGKGCYRRRELIVVPRSFSSSILFVNVNRYRPYLPTTGHYTSPMSHKSQYYNENIVRRLLVIDFFYFMALSCPLFPPLLPSLFWSARAIFSCGGAPIRFLGEEARDDVLLLLWPSS